VCFVIKKSVFEKCAWCYALRHFREKYGFEMSSFSKNGAGEFSGFPHVTDGLFCAKKKM
jgi:hypothetical protein